jgi:hypothetical protein
MAGQQLVYTNSPPSGAGASISIQVDPQRTCGGQPRSWCESDGGAPLAKSAAHLSLICNRRDHGIRHPPDHRVPVRAVLLRLTGNARFAQITSFDSCCC